MRLGLVKKSVEVVAYDAGWGRAFEHERAELVQILGDLGGTLHVEHIGSTAVPGLAAKPIVDIAIGVRDARAVGEALRRLRGGDRRYVKGANQPGMLFMVRGDPERRFHYHLVVFGTPAWRKVIAFRSLLRRHPGLVGEYGDFKRQLAERFRESRIDYMRHKRPIMRALLMRAYAEERRRRHAAAIRRQLAMATEAEPFPMAPLDPGGAPR